MIKSQGIRAAAPWIVAASLQLIMLVGMSAPYARHSKWVMPIGVVAWSLAKVLGFAALAAVLWVRRKQIVRALHRLLLFRASKTPVIVGLIVFIVLSRFSLAYLNHKWLQRFSTRYETIIELWQMLMIALAITAFALGVGYFRRRRAIGAPPLATVDMFLVSAALVYGAFWLAPALRLYVSMPLLVVAGGMLLPSRMLRLLYSGSIVVATVALFATAMRWRMELYVGNVLGPPPAGDLGHPWSFVYTAIQSAQPFGASMHIRKIPLGEDRLILTSLIGRVGYVPVLLIVATTVALVLWSWGRCWQAVPRGLGRKIVRYMGLASSGLLLGTTTVSALGNFAATRYPIGPGTGFFSPLASILLLGTVALWSASLMKDNDPAVRKEVIARWMRRGLAVGFGVLLLVACSWRIYIAQKDPRDTAMPLSERVKIASHSDQAAPVHQGVAAIVPRVCSQLIES